MKRVLRFLREEAVLSIAVVLALLSAAVVPPDAAYLGYIDFDTLLLLFALMAVMAGFRQLGLFTRLGQGLLGRVHTTRQMTLLLVLLPFFFSMLITNDVALLTFVPFAVTVLNMAGERKLLLKVAVLQTVGANLGSMLTPMGNPQNLYLYARSGMSLLAFLALTGPYVLLSLLCLAVLAALPRSRAVSVTAEEAAAPLGRGGMILCTAGFLLCLGSVAKLLPPLYAAAAVAVGALVFDRRLLRRVDYALLGTFVAFFVFIGNMGRMEWFRALLDSVLLGREAVVAVAASQVVSNVPAALLLSGFTERWDALIVGCNLGGLGTLIASMASLISYKQVALAAPGGRKRYLLLFTACNVGLLSVLLGLYALLSL